MENFEIHTYAARSQDILDVHKRDGVPIPWLKNDKSFWSLHFLSLFSTNTVTHIHHEKDGSVTVNAWRKSSLYLNNKETLDKLEADYKSKGGVIPNG